jgi:hypothetical protein
VPQQRAAGQHDGRLAGPQERPDDLGQKPCRGALDHDVGQRLQLVEPDHRHRPGERAEALGRLSRSLADPAAST